MQKNAILFTLLVAGGCDAKSASVESERDAALAIVDAAMANSDAAEMPLSLPPRDGSTRDALLELELPDAGAPAEDASVVEEDAAISEPDSGIVPVTPNECMSLHPLVDGTRRYCDPGACYCGINEDGCIRDDLAPSCCATLGLCCNQTCY